MKLSQPSLLNGSENVYRSITISKTPNTVPNNNYGNTLGTKESYDTEQRVQLLIDQAQHSSIDSNIAGIAPF